MIVHVPFERGLTRVRREGNFVAVEIKRDLSDVPAAFENLAVIEGALDYALTLVVMVNSSDTSPGSARWISRQKRCASQPSWRTASPWYEMQGCG